MNSRAYYTRDFGKSLEKVGRARRDLYRKVLSSVSEAQMKGGIADLSRTKHGESRIDNIEKYDLGDGYRLIVQVVSSESGDRAFLYVGDHDDCDKWIEGHRNYRWVKKESDGTLEFVQVTETEYKSTQIINLPNLDLPESTISLPLLRTVTDEEWRELRITEQLRDYASKISANDWERDCYGILEYVKKISNEETALLFLDIFQLACDQEYEKLSSRLALAGGTASIADSSGLADSLGALENSENVISFDDEIPLNELLEKGALADWLLFLHPKQRQLAFSNFNGPVRVRGVSGSGKTSVLVHRARFLALKKGPPVIVVTLTESMRKLLAVLLDELCGAERGSIQTYTMSSFVREIIDTVNRTFLHDKKIASPELQEEILRAVIEEVKQTGEFGSSSFRRWTDSQFRAFLRDEIDFIRSRLLPYNIELYLNTERFTRRGRGSPLSELNRKVCYLATRAYHRHMDSRHVSDTLGRAARALEILKSPERIGTRRYSALVADEVQDLSQVEMTILSQVHDHRGSRLSSIDNGLFLVGDGAQSIYKRGFSFREAGIDISGRSYFLKKNYRNTYEILNAAYALISNFSFADNDEEDLTPPSAPDFAIRRGSRPGLVRCRTEEEQVTFTLKVVKSCLEDGTKPGQICIVGTNNSLREAVHQELGNANIASVELRDDASYSSHKVKVSTIESSKGHEFAVVLVIGVNEGQIPRTGVQEEELAREASRLYVAMTRAREALWITYSRDGRGPSRYLTSIQSACDEYKFEDGVLSSLPPAEM